MIKVENLSKSFSNQILFEDASFQINPRERIGLVGRNGHGKTTLFRILVGEEQPSTGTISIPKNYRIGYVRQHLDFTQGTVLQEGMRGLREEDRHQQWKVKKILAGLGFSSEDMRQHPATFSGGHQVRLNLAKVLIWEPDLLLLDEPTNYLDITSIRWIERFLLTWSHELLLITHDRSFMDKLVTHTMGIHRRKIRKISGTTDKYYTQMAQDEEVYEKTRVNDERRQKEIGQFITRFRAKARLANLVQSRVKLLEKMEKRDKLETLKTLDFSFRSKPFKGKYALYTRDLCFSYNPPKPLINHLSITVNPRDRICVIGKNGKGKTTLLKLLSGMATPDSGTITISPSITKGIFEQTNIKTLVDTRTVVEEISFSHPDIDKQTAWNICGTMMFEDEHALKKISVLSGGEKSRVMLGKLLATPLNLLLLDEVTNHLDMESCDALLAALDRFEGAVIMVTHNEMFLHVLARRLIVFQHDSSYVFEGTYQDFLDKEGWEDEKDATGTSSKVVPETGDSNKQSKKSRRQKRSAVIAERSKVLKPLEQKIEQIENDIVYHEAQLKELTQAMQSAAQLKSGSKIMELSQKIHASRSAIEQLFTELEDQTGLLEERKADFDKHLAES